MGIIGGDFGYKILKRYQLPKNYFTTGEGVKLGTDELKQCFGKDFIERIVGKTVIDFGCGPGKETVTMALNGAARVIGLEIQPKWIKAAKELAEAHHVQDKTEFTERTDIKADIVLSKDAFEHFSDPAAMLRIMHGCLKPGGEILTSFGPTWLHPYGGHLFSVFPWAHLIFTEPALIRWRADHRQDGATKFSEVDGGLNQITICEFEKLVEASPLKLVSLDTIPIRGIGVFRHRFLREFGSSLVRAKLVSRN